MTRLLYCTAAARSLRAAKNWQKQYLGSNHHVATTTKPNLGHLASASEVVGGHTIPF
jgi:hypothetical protein